MEELRSKLGNSKKLEKFEWQANYEFPTLPYARFPHSHEYINADLSPLSMLLSMGVCICWLRAQLELLRSKQHSNAQINALDTKAKGFIFNETLATLIYDPAGTLLKLPYFYLLFLPFLLKSFVGLNFIV